MRCPIFGGDATSTAERLARFHRVENTYLSTFQTLGGLGLLLGTVGLATVLLRNVLERRRELALLAAVGYRPEPFPADGRGGEYAAACGRADRRRRLCRAGDHARRCMERGGRLPLTSGGALLLFAVFATGAAFVARRDAGRRPGRPSSNR